MDHVLFTKLSREDYHWPDPGPSAQAWGQDTSWSGTGTRFEDETASLPQAHYVEKVLIILA